MSGSQHPRNSASSAVKELFIWLLHSRSVLSVPGLPSMPVGGTVEVVRQRFRRFRSALNVALALLVLAASVHCAWESHHALLYSAAAANHRQTATPLPCSLPHGCDNESGCLCRGATQARAVDISHLTAEQTSEVLAFQQLIGLPIPSLHTSPPSGLPIDLAPPVSGRQLRALYASLLI
jgi:hypothetical protein